MTSSRNFPSQLPKPRVELRRDAMRAVPTTTPAGAHKPFAPRQRCKAPMYPERWQRQAVSRPSFILMSSTRKTWR